MRLCCVICSDPLDNAVPVVATGCGHVFHAACLARWTVESRTCPECRSRTVASPKRLYFSVDAEEDGTMRIKIEGLEGEAETVLDVSKRVHDVCLKVELALKHQREQLQCMKTKNAELRQETLNLKEKVDTLEAKVEHLETRDTVLDEELERLRCVQAMVSGSQRTVREILASVDEGPEGAKELATHVALLERQLRHAINTKAGQKQVQEETQQLFPFIEKNHFRKTRGKPLFPVLKRKE